MEKIEITKAFFHGGCLYPDDKGYGIPAYIATTDIGSQKWEYVKVYEADKHSAELEQKFSEDLMIALENTKKKINGKS